MLRHLTAALAATVVLASVPAVAGTTLNGAGGTAIYPVLSVWAAKYHAKTGTAVNYQAIGSGGGIQQITNKTVDFGNSDKPLKPEELDKRGLVQFPQVIISIVPVINLPGIKAGELKIDGPTLADIYLGKITKWNDPALEKLNPHVKLPDEAITVVHRSDGSGTTYNFADYLSSVSPAWKSQVGLGTSLNWPTGVGGKGNEGVSNYVQRLKGSIGYVEYAYISENHLKYARMINSAGKVVRPSLKGFQAAAANVDFTKARDFYVILTDQPGATSWPISGCTWQILRKDAPKATNEDVVKFFDWGFEHGQSMAKSLAFGPLPPSTMQPPPRSATCRSWSPPPSSRPSPAWPMTVGPIDGPA